MICPNCGTENNPDARFCKSCAAPQVPQATTPPATPAAPFPPPPPQLIPRPRLQPYEHFLGLLGFAFFLLAVAVVFGLNPSLIDGFRQWSHLVTVNNTIFVRPPDSVIVSAAWFFVIMGVFEFVSGFLRWSLRWLRLRAVSRVLTGIGDVIFALLLLRYADRAISGALVITVLVGVFAALLMIYITLGVYWSTARRVAWVPSPEPPTRQ